MAIPAGLRSGASPLTRDLTASKVTYAARSRKLTPTIFKARRSACRALRPRRSARKRQSKMPPDDVSMKESTPKPIRAMLPLTTPLPTATTPSIMFQPIVKYSRRIPRCSCGIRPSACVAMDLSYLTITLARGDRSAAEVSLSMTCRKWSVKGRSSLTLVVHALMM